MKKFLPLIITLLSLQAFAESLPYNIRIVEQNSKSPISNAYVRVIDLTAGSTIIGVSNDSGYVALKLNIDNKYRVDINKRATEQDVKYIGFSYFLEGVEILKPSFTEIGLEKVKVNTMMALSNIYFDNSITNLDGNAKIALANTLIALKNSPTLMVEIGIHAACNETDEVAAKRVEAIQQYFANKGELAKRVVIKNYGKAAQLAGCNCNSPVVGSNEAYHLNRVAEFKIINF